MIVIAIVAIMATLAVPGYLEKLIRDQVVEALPLGDVAKIPIAKAWATSQPLPRTTLPQSFPLPTRSSTTW
jgi:type IV pilus assembly protein PilA